MDDLNSILDPYRKAEADMSAGVRSLMPSPPQLWDLSTGLASGTGMAAPMMGAIKPLFHGTTMAAKTNWMKQGLQTGMPKTGLDQGIVPDKEIPGFYGRGAYFTEAQPEAKAVARAVAGRNASGQAGWEGPATRHVGFKADEQPAVVKALVDDQHIFDATNPKELEKIRPHVEKLFPDLQWSKFLEMRDRMETGPGKIISMMVESHLPQYGGVKHHPSEINVWDPKIIQKLAGVLPLVAPGMGVLDQPGQPVNHEKSETFRDQQGGWYNGYGQGNESRQPRGTPLPPMYPYEKDRYSNLQEAESAARRRSFDYGRQQQETLRRKVSGPADQKWEAVPPKKMNPPEPSMADSIRARVLQFSKMLGIPEDKIQSKTLPNLIRQHFGDRPDLKPHVDQFMADLRKAGR